MAPEPSKDGVEPDEAQVIARKVIYKKSSKTFGPKKLNLKGQLYNI